MNPVFFIEGSAGAAGNMILAALIDLGFPVQKLRENLSAAGVPVEVNPSTVYKNGIRAISLVPEFHETATTARGLTDFLHGLDESRPAEGVREKSAAVFRRLAEAEARIHGEKPEELHFHELGGWDTYMDVVGCVLGFEFFNPSGIFVGPLNVGSGSAASAHGLLPVPVPAVLELCQGFSVYASDIQNELVTPTAAAILATLGKPAPALPPMTLEKTGYGAGTLDLPIPNVLRILCGTAAQTGEETILKLETNIDDMNPQIWEHVFEKLYEAGALEVFLTPVLMKKSRPGHALTVLARPAAEEKLIRLLYEETTTLGIRKETVSRTALNRKIIHVPTPYGEIPCKVGYENGTAFNVAPEYEAVRAAAKEKKIPLKKIYQAVLKNI